MLLFVSWAALALFVTMPFDEVYQSAGIFVIETLGAYGIGRSLVHNERSFRYALGILFGMLLAMLPLAIYEMFTDHAIILETLKPVLNVAPKAYQDSRFGLHRAQVVFEHSILYGAFASSLLGLAYFAKDKREKSDGSVGWPVLVGRGRNGVAHNRRLGGTICPGSVHPVQERFTRRIMHRWLILTAIFICIYLIVDLLSNRSPFHVIVSYLTFSTNSAYHRILIWNYGSAEVLRHPLFGIGFNDWERPSWMGGSMDNFWLVISVTHGIPAVGFLLLAIFSMYYQLGRKKLKSRMLQKYRYGLFVSLGGLMICGATVDFWNAIYCWLLFLIGAGMWMLNAEETDVVKGDVKQGRAPRRRTIGRTRDRAISEALEV